MSSAEISPSKPVCKRCVNALPPTPTDEIAVVLLDQRVLAGLGNVYKSEVAFAAGGKSIPTHEHHHGTRNDDDDRNLTQIHEGECA